MGVDKMKKTMGKRMNDIVHVEIMDCKIPERIIEVEHIEVKINGE